MPPKRLRLSRMQRLHLLALGHIDSAGKRLVDSATIAAALENYRAKR